MSTQVILGIDPGLRITGYGVIAVRQQQSTCLTYGKINTQGDQDISRLQQIYDNLQQVIEAYQPHEIAIEKIFMHQNAQSALKLGQARGVALIAAGNLALPVYEYAPREVKQAIAGYGNADKQQMQRMIKILLKLDTLPPADAADALAIALCHSHTQKFKSKVTQALRSNV